MLDFIINHWQYFLGGALFMALYVAIGFFSAKPGTLKIVYRADQYYRAAGPGWCLRVPFLDRVGEVVNISLKTVPKNKLTVATKDNATVDVEYSYGWQIFDVHRAVIGVDNCVEYVATTISAAVSKYVGTVDYADLKQDNGAALSEHIKSHSRVALDTGGVKLHDVNFTHIGDVVEGAGKGDGGGKQYRSRMQTESRQIEAQGDKEVQEALSEAEARRIQILSETERDQLQELAKIFGCADKAQAFLLESKRIDALRALADSPTAKTIITSGENFGGTGIAKVLNVGEDKAEKPE